MTTSHDWLDKLLIALMVLILPVGIWYSATYGDNSKADEEAETQAVTDQKIDQVIENLKAAKPPAPAPTIPPIEIQHVSFATQSGELEVIGKAPGKNWTVMVSAIVTMPAKPTPKPKYSAKIASASAEASSSAKTLDQVVLGDAVEVKAVKTDENGNFTFKEKINLKDTLLLDLRFDQAQSTATIQYNFVENKRTL